MELYNRTSLAYDLSRFQRPTADEPQTAAREKTRVKPAQPPKTETLAGTLDKARGMDRAVASARRKKMTKTCALCLSVALMLGTVVYNQAQLAELNRDIARTEKEIVQLEGEYDRKTVELEQRINLETTEELATQQYGMTQLDRTQIEYITLDQAQPAPAAEQEEEGLLEKINKFVENLLAYIKGQ